jgi:hypothetical protein
MLGPFFICAALGAFSIQLASAFSIDAAPARTPAITTRPDTKKKSCRPLRFLFWSVDSLAFNPKAIPFSYLAMNPRAGLVRGH